MLKSISIMRFLLLGSVMAISSAAYALESRFIAAEVKPATAEVQTATAEIQPATVEIKKATDAIKVTPKPPKKAVAASKDQKPSPSGDDHSADSSKEVGDITIHNHGIQAIFINSDVTINGGEISGEINHAPEAEDEEKAEGAEGEEKKGEEGAKTAARPGGRPAEKPEKFAELVKDATKSVGLFTLYEKENKLYLEIKPEQLENNYLVSGSLATGLGQGWIKPGTFLGNTIIDKIIVSFQSVNDNIHMIQRNMRFISSEGELEAESVAKNIADSLVAAIPVEATNPENAAYVVDITKVVLGDLFQLADELRGSMGVGYGIDPSASYIKQVKSFPENLVIRNHYAFRTGMNAGLLVVPDSRSVQLETLMDIRPLKENKEFDSRVADNRVGYFIDAFVDFGNLERTTPFVRNITKWDIRKASPELTISPPAKPLTIWLENTIPDRYREPIRKGVLEWNKAFEAIGIKEAIQVHNQPKDATWDASDARYNTIHWNTSFDLVYGAVAQWISDPRTGEILNGGFLMESENIRGALNLIRRRSPDRIAMLKNQFEAPKTESPHFSACAYESNMAEQAALGFSILAARVGIENVSDELRNEIIDQLLFGVACHEMGHVLGLRHNFEGSTHISLSDLHNKALTSKVSISSSIMDYAPVNIAAPGEEQGFYFEPTIGPYDYFAIEYGYKPLIDAQAKELAAKKPPVQPQSAPIPQAATPETQAVTSVIAATAEIQVATASVQAATAEVAAATAVVASATAAEVKPATAVTKPVVHPVKQSIIEAIAAYGNVSFASNEQELNQLNQIAEKGELDPYHFGTDEDLYSYGGIDPLINQNDLTNDPLGYAKYLTGIIDETIPLLPNLIKPGDDYYFVRDAFDRLLFTYYNNATFAIKFLGGQYVNRVRKGGPNDPQPLVPVSPAKQREALDFISNVIFDDQIFDFDPQLLNLMAAEKWYHWGDSTFGTPHEYSLNSLVSAIYEVLIYQIYSPRVLQRIQDTEIQRNEQAVNFTLPELFNTMQQGIWREVYTFPANGGSVTTAQYGAKSPMISTFRRMAQRHHLRRMIEMSMEPTFGTPDDARTLSWQALNDLEKKLKAVLNADKSSINLDEYTRAHLTESHEKIRRALDAKLNVTVDMW